MSLAPEVTHRDASGWRETGATFAWCVVPLVLTSVAAVLGQAQALAGLVALWSVALWLGPGRLTQGQTRLIAALVGLIVLLVGKDLWPAGAGVGFDIRQLALRASGWEWLAYIRNPAIASAVAQVATLMLMLALWSGIVAHLNVRPGRASGLIQAMAWVLAGFGARVWWGTRLDLPYGPDNCVGAVANKNGAATLVALGTIMQWSLAALAVAQSRPVRAMAHGLTGVVLVVPLAGLAAWTGLSVLGAAMVALSFAILRLRRRRLGWVLAGAAIGVVGIASLSPVLTERLSRLATDFRWSIWRDTWPMLRASPVGGVGLGAFDSVYPLWGTLPLVVDARLAHPDSSWVKLILEWGLLPLIYFGAAIRWAQGKGAKPIWLAPVARVALVAAVGWVVSGATDNTWYRGEMLLVGVILGGVLWAQPAGILDSMRHRWAAVAGIVVAVGLVLWSQRAVALQWGQFDAERHWRKAAEANARNMGDPEALAHWRAAVRLQHRSASYPAAAATQLHAARPDLAAEFWRTAFGRSREMGNYFLQPALHSFPATTWTYWRAVVVDQNPDLLLWLPRVPPWEAEALAAQWLRQRSAEAISAETWRTFFDFTTNAKAAVVLARALPRIASGAPELLEPATLFFERHGEHELAWRAMQHLLPRADERQSKVSISVRRVETLLQMKHYAELSEALGAGSADRAALVRVCAEPDAPAWFFGQLAWAWAEEQRWPEAVTAGLTMLRRAQERRP